MKITYDNERKKLEVNYTRFDKLLNFLIVIAICGTAIICINKPDLSKYFNNKITETKVAEFSEGNYIDWDEYAKLIGNRSLLKQYVNQKNSVIGYISFIPTSMNSASGYYEVALTKDDSENPSATILLKIGEYSQIRNMTRGYYIIVDDLFTSDASSIYAYNPTIIPVIETTP